jgi:serine protease inhibitor
MDTRHNRYRNKSNHNYGSFSESNNVGEITGQVLNVNEIDQGMPMRTTYPRQQLQTEEPEIQYGENYNPHLDFNLYDKRSNIKVSYYDPISQGSIQTNFSDVNSDNQLLPPIERIDPETKFSASINLFTWNFFNQFNKYMDNKSSLVISPFNLVNIFSILYKGSKGNTEQEIKSFLNFNSKDQTILSMNKINHKIKSSYSILLSNFLLFPNIYPVNRAFSNYVSDLSIVANINLSNINNEVIRINNIVRNSTNNIETDIISPSYITKNTCMLIINVTVFYNKWKIGFNPQYTQLQLFNSIQSRQLYMMQQVNTIHNYFEDNVNKIIELDFNNTDFVMGFILSKNGVCTPISDNQFSYYIAQLKPHNIKSLKIPKFKQKSKYKIDNLFKRLGLNHLFNNADLSEITQSNNDLYISDIIHDTLIVIDESGNPNNKGNDSNNRNIQSVNFIANYPFIYYIRYKPTNTILLVGQFY